MLAGEILLDLGQTEQADPRFAEALCVLEAMSVKDQMSAVTTAQEVLMTPSLRNPRAAEESVRLFHGGASLREQARSAKAQVRHAAESVLRLTDWQWMREPGAITPGKVDIGKLRTTQEKRLLAFLNADTVLLAERVRELEGVLATGGMQVTALEMLRDYYRCIVVIQRLGRQVANDVMDVGIPEELPRVGVSGNQLTFERFQKSDVDVLRRVVDRGRRLPEYRVEAADLEAKDGEHLDGAADFDIPDDLEVRLCLVSRQYRKDERTEWDDWVFDAVEMLISIARGHHPPLWRCTMPRGLTTYLRFRIKKTKPPRLCDNIYFAERTNNRCCGVKRCQDNVVILGDPDRLAYELEDLRFVTDYKRRR